MFNDHISPIMLLFALVLHLFTSNDLHTAESDKLHGENHTKLMDVNNDTSLRRHENFISTM